MTSLAPTGFLQDDSADLERLRTLIASLQAGVLVEDEHGRIVLANEELCHAWGIHAPPEVLIGADCAAAAEASLALLAEPERFSARLTEILADRAPVLAERVAFRDGRVFERDYLPIWAEAHYRGHLWVYREITERVRFERELRAARDAALQAATAKADFLATMSHEIRTPMNGIVATLELLRDSRLTPAQRELLAIVEESSGVLRVLLDDILDLSKIEAGRIELDEQVVDLRALVSQTVALSSAAALQRGLRLHVDVSDDVPEAVVVDPARLRQILHNLMSNAVKFTADGSVTVRVAIRPTAEGAPALALAVADTGIGIAEPALPRLFEPFTQADASTTRRFGGSGLGLAIVRRLAERMGGTAAVASRPGEGSTFTIELPLRVGASAAPPDATRRRAQDGSDLQTLGRVLLAEDIAINREVILRQLRRLGVEADAVADGAEAVAALRERSYALVLMDCHMPVLDGFDATRAIRALDGPSASVPIVALTANAMDGDREACLAAGMDDYLAKPLVLDDLRRALGAHARPGDETASCIDRDRLFRLAEELNDHEGVGAMTLRYVDELDGRLVAIRSAPDGIALAGAAHALTSPSRMFGAVDLAELCAELERHGRAGKTAPGPLLARLPELASRTEAQLRRAAAALAERR